MGIPTHGPITGSEGPFRPDQIRLGGAPVSACLPDARSSSAREPRPSRSWTVAGTMAGRHGGVETVGLVLAVGEPAAPLGQRVRLR